MEAWIDNTRGSFQVYKDSESETEVALILVQVRLNGEWVVLEVEEHSADDLVGLLQRVELKG